MNEQAELGLSKDIREMLPVVIYKESFIVKDSQWVLIFIKILSFFCVRSF